MQTRYRALALAGALVLSSSALAGYVFTPITGPAGSKEVSAWGINNAGVIAVNTDSGAYLYAGGVYKSIAGPNFYAGSVNDSGMVAGGMYDAATMTHTGFLVDSASGAMTPVTIPGAVSVELRGIANSGAVAGSFTRADGSVHAFVRNPAGAISYVTAPPGSAYNVAQGINSFGQAVGSFSATGAFLYNSSTGVTDNFTLTPARPASTRARAINDHGQIAGYYIESPEHVRGFIGTAAGYQVLDHDGYQQTFVQGMNNAGQLVGVSYDADYHLHAFLATPAVLPASTTGGVYTFLADVIAGVPIFIDPLVATGYDYAIGATDPRIGQVRLPNNVGDNIFEIILPDGGRFTLQGGELFDFTAHGFADGVAGFSVRGIETGAGLDPNNPQAFITQLVFLGSGSFTGTMAAVTALVPEPGSAALILLGLAGLGVLRRRRLTGTPLD